MFISPARLAAAAVIAAAGPVALHTSVAPAAPTVVASVATHGEAAAEAAADAAVDAAVDAVSVSLRPEIEVTGASDEQRSALEEALERFRGAGLPLPDLEVVFAAEHEQQAPCSGHYGVFQPRPEGWRVVVCSDVAFVLTHELAHAWERANVDDRVRDAYTAARGYESWNDAAAAWGERGIEDAAHVVQQNLMAGYADLASQRWIDLTAAYELLTGRTSPVLTGDTSAGSPDGAGSALPVTAV